MHALAELCTATGIRRRFIQLSLVLSPALAHGQYNYVNWESPHVSPLALTLDGTRLLAVNTSDNRLEILDLTTGAPRALASIPVGVEPVTVRPFSNDIAWVVNQISDSISVVSLSSFNVIATLRAKDEPADVVFAGSPLRAFVSCSQSNEIHVFDPADLTSPPTVIPIAGERPRGLVVSPDGRTVFVAIFEGGNTSTILDRTVVSAPDSPYAGINPPPNSGNAFVPPLTPGLPPAPPVSIIVRKDATGRWMDDNSHNWSGFVTWDVHDHDVAAIRTDTLAVSYFSGLMNINMALAVQPDGRLLVVGTDATNQIRFEPNVTAKFVHSRFALVDPTNPSAPLVGDLNPQLASAYQQGLTSVPAAKRALSIADPRGIATRSDGSAHYVSGMGSNNVVVLNAQGQRIGQVDVGGGPTGLALDEPRGRVYVLNKFDATISVIDTASVTEIQRVGLTYDPTPADIAVGRQFLFNARETSGLGVTACAACHVDGRKDGLAWDLGNPAGEMKAFDQTCLGVLAGGECSDWHPLKGPMTTQTLQGIIGTEPLHWRGDRENLAAFNGAFVSLLGGDTPLSSADMANFQSFISSIQYPPNPNRDLSNALSTNVDGGDAVQGEVIFRTELLDSGAVRCNQCHALPAGTDQEILPADLPLRTAPQVMKIPQLRGALYKAGFDKSSVNGARGFGFVHDGTTDTLLDFLSGPEFTFPAGRQGEQEKRDLVAYLMSFSTDTHAAVGAQVTQAGPNNQDPSVAALIDQFLALAEADAVGLIVKGRVGGAARGYAYIGHGVFQSDRAAEQVPSSTLRAQATAGEELTWTIVSKGSEIRSGIDRNSNGILDADEPPSCIGDLNGDHYVNLADLAIVLSDYGCTGACPGDINHDGRIDLTDLSQILAQYGAACP